MSHESTPLNAPSTSPAPIDRIQENLLARSERRLLNWICARLPGWVTPDKLTGIGMIGAFMLIALTLAMMHFGHTGQGWFGTVSGFDLFTGTVGAILIGLFVMQTFVTARRLSAMEPSRNHEWDGGGQP
jgi:hypothetical protein